MSPSKRVAIAIGGGEDKQGECAVLGVVSRETHTRRPGARIVIVTAASRIPAERYERYLGAFGHLGGPPLTHLHLADRAEATAEALGSPHDPPGCVFFSGGNQNVLAELLLGTPMHAVLLSHYHAGVVIAGTSAGASILGGVMPGPPERRDGERALVGVRVAEGLGMLPRLIVDQHFTERDRRRRLLLAVADRPGFVGIGVDEDTAVVIEDDERCSVTGRGTVTVCENAGSDAEDADAMARTCVIHRAGDAFLLPSR